MSKMRAAFWHLILLLRKYLQRRKNSKVCQAIFSTIQKNGRFKQTKLYLLFCFALILFLACGGGTYRSDTSRYRYLGY